MSASGKLTRRTILATGGALAAAFSFPRPALAQAIKVKYTLSWLPTGHYAYLYVARQLGFWKKRGLDVEISRGYGSLAAIQAIASGQFDMGGAQCGANLLSIMKNVDLKLMGTHGYDATLGIAVAENGPIKTPKDLEGRKLGVVAAGGDFAFLPAYCKLAGVDMSKIAIVNIDSKILEQSFMQKVVDACVITGLSSIPNFVTENFAFKFLPFSDAGLEFYWINTLTSGAYLAKNKEVVDLFQDGIVEGQKFMLLNPKESAERHIKEHDEFTLGKNGKLYVELGLGMASAIMAAPEAIQHGLGYTDLGKLDVMAKSVKQYAAGPNDKDPPAAAAICSNNSAGKMTLTAAEWDQVKTSNQKYAQMLGKA